MKHILISIFLGISFLSHVVFAQEVKIDSGLLRDIASGHQLLALYAESLSGRIEYSSDVPVAGGEQLIGRFLFFRDKDLLRLESIAPKKGTEILPGHEKNDITSVVMKSKEYYYEYRAIPTTGVPSADVSRSTVPDEAMKITLNTGFLEHINVLFAPSVFLEARVVDILQDKIGNIGNRPYKEVLDALWIESPKITDTEGSVASWVIVLNPKQHYALLFCEVCLTNPKMGLTATSSVTVSSQITDDGKVLPKEILFKGQTKVTAHGREQEVNTGKHTSVTIFSTAKPDSRLFTEESFKDLGRDYTVVDILPNQKMAQGGHVVSAAPLASRMPYYPPIEGFSREDWPWWRIVFVSVGVIMIAIACLRMYLKWRHSSNK